MSRCRWAESSDTMCEYHDREWGVPSGDDRDVFERICLEGFQSGLSWSTILNRREGFRRAFRGFEIESVASMTESDVELLMTDESIIRHRGKIRSVINNARRCLELDEWSLAAHIWRFEPTGVPPIGATTCPESEQLAKDLKKRGWTFVGPTTMYAMMQALGMVNDHEPECPARRTTEAARSLFTRPTRHTADR